MKLQMMQEVALESDIQWDSKALDQSLYKPPPFVQVNHSLPSTTTHYHHYSQVIRGKDTIQVLE
ncbi:hypothetical protein Ccrd_022367, partial [Cynara cardunculus var. scolymus]